MSKKYTCLGMMSGTSGDGVDASIILSNGQNEFEVINEKYYEYDNDIYLEFHDLKKKINTFKDLNRFATLIKRLEEKIQKKKFQYSLEMENYYPNYQKKKLFTTLDKTISLMGVKEPRLHQYFTNILS